MNRISMNPAAVLTLLSLLLPGGSRLVVAQSTGSFTAVADMTTARERHTATLLPDGTVLIAGGIQFVDDAVATPGHDCSGHCGVALASCESYDPATGTFTPIGNMSTPRSGHSATLLPDGRVLITGGSPEMDTPATAELYDPLTKTFTTTGNMTTAGGTAMLLGNGKVLIAGVPNAELYDPDSGTFTRTSAYTAIKRVFSASLLTDGTALVLGDGGANAYGMWSELFDPASGAFTLTGPMPDQWREAYSATLLQNGKLLIAGGDNDVSYFSSAEVYDRATGTFGATGNLTTYRDFSPAVLLPNGGVLIVGGQLYGGSGTASTELYDPAAETFSIADNMIHSRSYGHTTTLLSDGTVLIAGGDLGKLIQVLGTQVFSPSAASSAELYSPRVLVPAPALFSMSGDGGGQGAIWHAETGLIASVANPAGAGDILAMYTSGLVDGGIIPPQVSVGGRLAEILFFGAAPGYPGFNQVNFRVPYSIGSRSKVPVRLSYLGRSRNEVTIEAHF